MKTFFRYAAAVLAGAAVCGAVLLAKGISGLQAQALMRVLSDAFTAAAVLLLLACALVWITRQGTFRGMGYTVRRIFVALHSQEYRDAHKETYSEYCDRKGLRRTPCLFLLISGCVYLVPAIVFTVLYFYI